MKVKDQKFWDAQVKANTDPYGGATIKYTEAWANLMEKRMADGTKLADIAKQASHDADEEGITGFMDDCAVSVLAKVWEHGEELRHWHNLDTQIGDEGEKANESGGTLNPALLNIG